MEGRCKWCGELVPDKEQHEPNCNLNDGGRSDMNYEDISNKFFN
jgi:hypothetical protein